MKNTSLVLLAVSTFTMSSFVLAEEQKAAVPAAPATGEVGTTSTQAAPSIVDSLYLNYFAVFHGMPLNNMGSPYTIDNTGKQSKTNAINFDSDISAAYMVSKNTGIGFE